jgi:uncharacterized protein (TIGR03083 family)
VPNVARDTLTAAFAGEAAALSAVTAGLTDSDLERPSSCPPWTAGELLCHMIVATARVRQALAEPEPGGVPLVPAPDYYRPDERFSPAANASRVETARQLAARLRAPGAMSAELDRVTRDSQALLAAAPAGRIVRTRHGDAMLLTDFARTRIVELGVHGLDLAISLDQPPWLTGAAAVVVTGLLLPGGGAAELQAGAGWDQVTLVAKLTGREPVTEAEGTVLRDSGIRPLTLS